VFDLFPYDTARRIDAEDRRIMTTGEPLLDRERSSVQPDGEVRWIASSKVPLIDAAGTIFGLVGVNRDVTERKRMERELTVSEQTLRATFTQARAGITVISLDLQYLDVNEQYCDIVGYSRDELLGGMKLTEVCVPESVEETTHACRRLVVGDIHSDSREQRLKRKNRTLVWVTSAISLVRDSDGKAKHFVSVTQDISGTKLAEARLVQLAHFDTLTGLPNRTLFNQKVRESLEHARSSQWRTGVMFIDVDRFKNVNDTLGHIEGDKLLQQIAARLSGAVRRGDSVGRLGGDEFAVVLTDLAAIEDAATVAQKIVGSFSAPFQLGDSEIYVSASIGIALHPDHATDQDTLIRNADAAMYEAKKRGRNGYQFYTPELNARAVELLTFESDLRRALERQEFVLHYQPKCSVATGEITGLEALLRWEHPVKGLVSPRDFIPLLEETGLIVPVGEWVFESVCRQIGEWRRRKMNVVPISINISARQFTSLQVGENLRRILQRCRTDPGLLELELTESALMVSIQEAIRTLEALKLLGLSLSIDDFGTGYSSLSYLKRFPLDTLKIDRSFVKDIPEDKDDCAITLAVISMAHRLGLSVVAEGVETVEQVEFLRQHGCDQLQGFHLAKPMAAEVCERWMNARRVR
jgi:diguanylate cyclase (GGDEF)-like protein/PAS domain S-box-containing protein